MIVDRERKIKELKEKIFDLDMKDVWESTDMVKWLGWHRELKELEEGK